ncbi:VOC family protein [Paraglaciecola sp.]|uniref:VOC family protein n=1 Tax=Paraglaciecola sp. TaxID=1920173 RepID=UPI0030F423D0
MIEFQTMFPVMVATDLEALKHFYGSVFGFSAVFYDPSFYLHLVSPSNGVQLGFMVPNHESQPAFLHARMVTEGYVLSFEVSDAKKVFQQVTDLALEVVMPLKDEVWGQRHFMIKDPAGIRIDIIEHFEAAQK